MPLSVSRAATEAKSRVALIHVLDLNLRLMEGWRRVQEKLHGAPLDCESTMILMAIVSIGAETLLRSNEIEEFGDLSRPIDLRFLRKCNLSSIAATTGLNRETVRRKVGVLASKGIVVRETGEGVTMAEGLMQRPEIREIINEQLAAIAGTADRLRRDGLLRRTSQVAAR